MILRRPMEEILKLLPGPHFEAKRVSTLISFSDSLPFFPLHFFRSISFTILKYSCIVYYFHDESKEVFIFCTCTFFPSCLFRDCFILSRIDMFYYYYLVPFLQGKFSSSSSFDMSQGSLSSIDK